MIAIGDRHAAGLRMRRASVRAADEVSHRFDAAHRVLMLRIGVVIEQKDRRADVLWRAVAQGLATHVLDLAEGAHALARDPEVFVAGHLCVLGIASPAGIAKFAEHQAHQTHAQPAR